MPDDNLFFPIPAVLPPTESVATQHGGASARLNLSAMVEHAIRLTAERENMTVAEVVRLISERGPTRPV